MVVVIVKALAHLDGWNICPFAVVDHRWPQGWGWWRGWPRSHELLQGAHEFARVETPREQPPQYRLASAARGRRDECAQESGEDIRQNDGA